LSSLFFLLVFASRANSEEEEKVTSISKAFLYCWDNFGDPFRVRRSQNDKIEIVICFRIDGARTKRLDESTFDGEEEKGKGKWKKRRKTRWREEKK
jgi:hypothetical protein